MRKKTSEIDIEDVNYDSNAFWELHNRSEQFKQLASYAEWCLSSFKDKLTMLGHDLVRINLTAELINPIPAKVESLEDLHSFLVQFEKVVSQVHENITSSDLKIVMPESIQSAAKVMVETIFCIKEATS